MKFSIYLPLFILSILGVAFSIWWMSGPPGLILISILAIAAPLIRDTTSVIQSKLVRRGTATFCGLAFGVGLATMHLNLTGMRTSYPQAAVAFVLIGTLVGLTSVLFSSHRVPPNETI